MTNTICLDENYSTTRLVIQADPQVIANEVKQSNKPEDKFESVLFLPIGENRKGEGGLRTKGYFKKSYSHCEEQSDEAIYKPLISIITVVYNGEKYLEETIQSVLNQSYDNVEYIIIDGGSTDGTLDIIKKYEDRIDYWVSERDSGIYDAMNKGIDVATGEWINFMNAGDVFYKMDTVYGIFDGYVINDSTDIIYGNLEINYGDFSRIEKAKSLDTMWKGMSFSHQSCFINSYYHKFNKYSLRYQIADDFDFFYSSYNNKRIFKHIDSIISIMDVEGLSDGNRFKAIGQRHQIINRDKIILKYNSFYIGLYIDQLIRKIFKIILPKIVIDKIKKNK